jgi:ribonuclease P/MRP protein subunit RPP40
MRMVSGLTTDRYKERLKEIGLTTLEERRYRLHMVPTYKILTGKENVKSDTWFQLASGAARATRPAADPWNNRPQPARLDIRRNFFTNCLVEGWNKIPAELKMAKTAKGFKKGYAKHHGDKWIDQ